MIETVIPKRTAVEIWQELYTCIKLKNIIAEDMISNLDLLGLNTYQTRIDSLTREASERFSLVPDPEIGDPTPPLPQGKKFFSQWYAETAELAMSNA